MPCLSIEFRPRVYGKADPDCRASRCRHGANRHADDDLQYERQSNHTPKYANQQRYRDPNQRADKALVNGIERFPDAFLGHNQRLDWSPDRMLKSDKRG